MISLRIAENHLCTVIHHFAKKIIILDLDNRRNVQKKIKQLKIFSDDFLGSNHVNFLCI
jgi:hypothetical protein